MERVITRATITRPPICSRTLWTKTYSFLQSFAFREKPQLVDRVDDFVINKDNFPNNLKAVFFENFKLYPKFITQAEHDILYNEVEPLLSKLRYEISHWDQVIIGYREIERHLSKWSPACTSIFDRVRTLLPSSVPWREGIHILDLKDDGEIKHHIDNVNSSGPIICGISLLSDAILQLKDEKTEHMVSVHLPLRSLYIMKGFVRYNYSHALTNEIIEFKGTKIQKKRRISILIRDNNE